MLCAISSSRASAGYGTDALPALARLTWVVILVGHGKRTLSLLLHVIGRHPLVEVYNREAILRKVGVCPAS